MVSIFEEDDQTEGYVRIIGITEALLACLAVLALTMLIERLDMQICQQISFNVGLYGNAFLSMQLHRKFCRKYSCFLTPE